MVHARITPWSSPEELTELKGWFYEKKTGGEVDEGSRDARDRAIQRVKCYQSKGSQYLPHVIDSTAQITSAMLLDERKSDEGNNDTLAVRLTYAMALIRFVNGLLDPTQQSQFAIPLHTLAKKVGVSSWFVDLRHWGTHERELPSLDMLRSAAKEALEWLWNHYWNDEELEEEESSDDEEGSAVSSREIETLILAGLEIEGILIENRWLWDGSSRNLISSSNFDVDESTVGGRRKHTVVSPPDRVNGYVTRCRNVWRQESGRKVFVEACLKDYNSTLLELFTAKLSRFDLEFFSAVTDNYTRQIGGEETTVLKRKFPGWNDLKRLLKKFVGSINLGVMATSWSLWEASIEAHPSFVTLWICASILKRLNENSGQLPARKKRKKRQNETWLELETHLSAMVQRLSKRFNDSDARLYDLSTARSAAPVAPSKPTQATSDILNDLANLRQRLKKPKAAASQGVKLWTRYPDWEPKPFGVL